MNKKIPIGSIIAVVILVLVSSSSAIDVNYDDNEIEPVDTTIEIISLINGICEECESEGNSYYFHRNVSFFGYGHTLNIRAFTINPLIPFFYNEDANTIHANRFIGLILQVANGIISVTGIALGNIEWS